MPEIQASREPWNHGAQADFDQTHAEAIDLLRGAKTYGLIVLKELRVDEDGEPRVTAVTSFATCETKAHTQALIVLMADSCIAIQENFDALDEQGDGDGDA